MSIQLQRFCVISLYLYVFIDAEYPDFNHKHPVWENEDKQAKTFVELSETLMIVFRKSNISCIALSNKCCIITTITSQFLSFYVYTITTSLVREDVQIDLEWIF